MSNQQIPYKIYLNEDEMPKQWYNLRADMVNKPAPLLDPETHKPMTAKDLSGVFCDELIRQELDDTTAYFEIPEDIRVIVDQQIPKAAADKKFTRTSALCIASVPKDRFAGLWGDGGEIVTRAFTVCGDNLKLTADVKAGGRVKMEVLDETGVVVNGYGAEEFCTVETDVTDKPVRWGNRDLSELKEKTIFLRILLQNAGVFTLGGGIAAAQG